MDKKQPAKLVRALGLSALIVYGVGDILGAGIYALIGKIAGHAGTFTWLSFVIALIVILFTALSYSELSSRYPRSGGVSIYIEEAFRHKGLAVFSGLLLFSATILSMSTLSQAFVGYLRSLGLNVPNWLGLSSFLVILLAINLRGIKQSSIANIISTAIELSGLMIVIICGLWYLFHSNAPILPTPQTDLTPSIGDILQGTALAFFAFTGFEDLANVAEEVKKPERNLPYAILSALSIAGFLYLAVSWTATAVMSGHELSQSQAPLLAVVNKSYPAMPSFIFSIIAIFAVSNSTLVNYITASRLLYGMSEANLLPKVFQTVHNKYHTPYIAIFIIFPIVLSLGLWGTLKGLASSTSAVVLTVFSLSSIALIKIKISKGINNKSVFQIPMFIPCLAVVLNVTAITFLPLKDIIVAALFVCGNCIISWLITTRLRGQVF